MPTPSPHRPEPKKILKQKLINYQNEFKAETDIVIYDGFHTSSSQKFINVFKQSIQFDSSKEKKHKKRYTLDYEQYLNDKNDELNAWNSVNRKSLTRENILAINKKAKVIKSSLNEINRMRGSVVDNPVSYNSAQILPTTPSQIKDLSPRQMNQTKNQSLSTLLTIRQSKRQQPERPYDYMRTSVSQQSTRKRPLSSTRPKTSLMFTSQKPTASRISTKNTPNPEKPQLTEYYTPCYHKQTKTGYIINEFQPRLRTRHFEDNVKMMAKIIKKKILNLQKGQIVQYLKKLGTKQNEFPNGKIQEMVRKNNFISQRNVLESKLVKAGQVEYSRSAKSIKKA